MGPLLATVIPLSLGAMVSPTLLAAIVLVLSMPIAPRARAWAVVAGATVAMLVLTLAAPIAAQAMRSVKPMDMHWADVILGVLLLALAASTLLRKHNASQAAKHRAPVAGSTPHARLFEFAMFGIVLIATDFSSTVLYLAAMKDIGQAHIPMTAKAAVLAIPFVAVLAPALVPTFLSSVAPKQSDALLEKTAAWTGDHSKAITVAICVIFGVYLLAKGLPPLLR
jgi:hypothetical protein